MNVSKVKPGDWIWSLTLRLSCRGPLELFSSRRLAGLRAVICGNKCVVEPEEVLILGLWNRHPSLRYSPPEGLSIVWGCQEKFIPYN